jgi:hypothetical protein
MQKRSLLLIGGLFLAACGDSGTDAAGGGGAGSGGNAGVGGDGQGGAASNNQTFTITFDPVTVAPGSENTQCVVKRLGNDAAIKVHEIHNQLDQGSHHLIVYRTNDTEEAPDPVDCQPFVDTLDPEKGSPLMVTQKHDETLTLPDGVAFTLDANVMVRLEMHYINAGTEPIEVAATSTFETMPEEDFENAADFLFLGNPDIDIQPNSSFSLGPTFLPLPENLAGSKFFGITGHTHQWGTNVTVEYAADENAPGTSLYDVPGWLWSEPATVKLDPPVELEPGAGFRFTCEYDNMSSSQVGFGESANDEMCFFWAYYYPSKGAFVCAHTDQVAGGFDLCCPGSPFCDQVFN